MKNILSLIFGFICFIGNAQINSEIYFGECSNIIINDYDRTPYLDTLLYHFNYDLENIMEYDVIDIMLVNDLTCVKTYEIIHGDVPVISFGEPDFGCYEIGWTKVSLMHIEYYDDSCGVNMTTIYMLP